MYLFIFHALRENVNADKLNVNTSFVNFEKCKFWERGNIIFVVWFFFFVISSISHKKLTRQESLNNYLCTATTLEYCISVHVFFIQYIFTICKMKQPDREKRKVKICF